MKKFIFVLFGYLLLITPNAFAEEQYRCLDLDVPVKIEVAQIYDNYMQELYNATNKAFKNYKFNNFGMKFGAWDASVSCWIDKNGITEKFLVQGNNISKIYTLINGQYIETEDLHKKYSPGIDFSNLYYNSDLLPHPIRKKAYFKYKDEFDAHMINFISNYMPVIPFPDGIQHDKLHVCMHLYYVPFDPVRYIYGKIEIWQEPLYFSGRGDPIHNVPPSWTFDIIRN